MKDYETLKKELSERRKNIKGFNLAFYKIFAHEMEVARQALEESKQFNFDFSVTEFWKNSETHKTWFYRNNGGAYCEILQICE